MNIADGHIFYFDKPYQWTSFNLVAKVRRQLCLKLRIKKLKVGHAGTLDPLATGVMVVCAGRATKRINESQAHVKEHVATPLLAATTPSFHPETPIAAPFPTSHITREALEAVLRRFVGRIEQVPPSFSACKVDGHRAYDLARKGREVELQPKVLVISEIELLSVDATSMQCTLRVVCSKGTYIRALARDIGEALHSGAHLTALRRTRVGDVRVEDCMQVDDFDQWLEEHPITYTQE